jgi:enoyl-CoA hydratase
LHAEHAPEADPLHIERLGPVAVLTLDRPPVNALDTRGYRRTTTALTYLDQDASIQAIILTGAGHRAFCAGTDTADLANTESLAEVTEASLAFFETLSHLQTPLVGALNGPAVGGGAMIAAECDVLIAVRTARLAIPELHLGFPGAASHLKRLVPYPVALRMLLIGEQPDAAQLLRMGSLAEVVDNANELRESALRHAATIAALDPTAAIAARQIFRRTEDAQALNGYRDELQLLRRILKRQLAGTQQRVDMPRADDDRGQLHDVPR